MMLNICLHAYFPNTWLFHKMSGWTIFHLDYFFSSCWVSHCILNTILWWKYIVKIFPAILWFVFSILLIVSFTKQAFLLLMKYFNFYGLCFDVMTKIILSNTWSWRFFFSKRFIVLDFTHGCMVHFVIFLKFLCKVWNLGQDLVICLGISNCP